MVDNDDNTRRDRAIRLLQIFIATFFGVFVVLALANYSAHQVINDKASEVCGKLQAAVEKQRRINLVLLTSVQAQVSAGEKSLEPAYAILSRDIAETVDLDC